jgi:hypothetical protein
MTKARKFLAVGLIAATFAAGVAAATPASAFSCVTAAGFGAAAIGVIAAGAVQQKQCYHGYGYPPAQFNYGSVSPHRSRRGHTCTQAEWDPLQGYVQLRGPCK